MARKTTEELQKDLLEVGIEVSARIQHMTSMVGGSFDNGRMFSEILGNQAQIMKNQVAIAKALARIMNASVIPD